MIAYALTSSMIISLLSYPDIHFLAYDIKHGGIAYSLLKPMDFQLQFLLKDTGIALAYFIALFPVCVAAMFVLNTSVDLTSNWPCFIISLTIGIFLSFTINFIFGSLCFWVENSWGISNFRHVVVGFLSGAILPLDLISIRLSRLSLYFPFAGIVYIPAGILTDQFEKQNIGVLLLIQICWVLILWVIGKLIYQKVKRLVVINGG
jgi:ABC-2 type transport system permease protein